MSWHRLRSAPRTRQIELPRFTDAEREALHEASRDLDETLSIMQAELGARWLDPSAVKVRGWNLDYVRGIKHFRR